MMNTAQRILSTPRDRRQRISPVWPLISFALILTLVAVYQLLPIN